MALSRVQGSEDRLKAMGHRPVGGTQEDAECSGSSSQTKACR